MPLPLTLPEVGEPILIVAIILGFYILVNYGTNELTRSFDLTKNNGWELLIIVKRLHSLKAMAYAWRRTGRGQNILSKVELL
jgi:hypothetical protein